MGRWAPNSFFGLRTVSNSIDLLFRRCLELAGVRETKAGKDGGQEEKGVTEHEMVGWHH